MFQSIYIYIHICIDRHVGFGGDGLTWHLESYRHYTEKERQHPPSSDSFPKAKLDWIKEDLERGEKRKREEKTRKKRK